MFNFILGSSCPNVFYRLSSRQAFVTQALLNADNIGQLVEIKGWVKSLRNQKENVFADVSDGLSHKKVQVIIPKDMKPKTLSTGASIVAKGRLRLSPKGDIEVAAEQLEVCGECVVTDGYPFLPRKEYNAEYIRQYSHFRPKTNKFSSLLRVRNRATLAFHNYLDSEGFINIHNPILTSNDCEGAGEVFKVIPDNELLLKLMKRDGISDDETYFGAKTFLTVSGQLHLEAAAHGLSKVYCFGPTFRAENSKSRLHLSEFYMLEAEMAFLDRIEDLMILIENLLKSVTKLLISQAEGDIMTITKDNPMDYSWIEKPFPVITYEEAVKILKDNENSYEEKFNEQKGFTKEHEVFLVKYSGNLPTFIIDWSKDTKPFYMRESPHDSNKVSALDLLAPNVGEIVGGSLRENSYSKLKEKLPKDSHLDWYLELRKFGSVSTGGFGMGFERYLQFILGISNIKDTIPYPRWPHNCNL